MYNIYSLGVTLYCLFYGKYPFGNYANEVIEIYKEILKNNFTFPTENSKVENVNNFIKCLLNKKVNERICNVSALKKKPFFEGFEFDKLNDFRLIYLLLDCTERQTLSYFIAKIWTFLPIIYLCNFWTSTYSASDGWILNKDMIYLPWRRA